MISGKSVAYNFVQPPNSDLSRTILQQEQLNNAHEQRKALAEKQKSEDNLAQLEKIGKINPGQKTGYNHIDSAFADAYNRKGGLIEQYVQAQKRLKESNNTDAEAFGIIKNIEGFTKNIAMMKQGFFKASRTLKEGVAKGKFSKALNEGYISNIDKIEKGGIFIDTSDIRDIKIQNLGKTDFDGDGLPDTISLETFKDINNFGVFEADFNLESFNQGLKKSFGTTENELIDPNDPYKTTTEKGFDPKNALLVKDKYQQVLGADPNSLTNKGKSLLIQFGIKPSEISKEEYSKFLDSRVLEFQKQYDYSRKEDIDFGAKNQATRNRLSRDIHNFNKDKFDYEKIQDANTEEKKDKDKVFILKAGDKVQSSRNPKNEMQVDFGIKPITMNIGGEKVEIQKLGIAENGEISYEGVSFEDKKEIDRLKKLAEKETNATKRKNYEDQIEQRSTKARGMDIEDLGLIAIKLGYKNYDELKEVLEKQLPERQSNTPKLSEKASIL